MVVTSASLADGVLVPDVGAADYEAAFWPLFRAAFRAAHRILGDRHAAEDVAADALTAAHLQWRRIATLPYRDAWVVRVATNRALDVARRRRQPADEAGEVRFEDGMANRMALVAALRALPRRQREVVVLRMLVGLPPDDVASVLGIGTASVRTHLGRGMRALRKHLDAGEER